MASVAFEEYQAAVAEYTIELDKENLKHIVESFKVLLKQNMENYLEAKKDALSKYERDLINKQELEDHLEAKKVLFKKKVNKHSEDYKFIIEQSAENHLEMYKYLLKLHPKDQKKPSHQRLK